MSTTGNAESYIELRGSLSIPDAIHGKSAYELAVMHGFNGTEEEWLLHLERAQSEAVEEAAEQAKTDIATNRQTALSDIANDTQTALSDIEQAHTEVTTDAAQALTDIAEAKATMLEEIELAAEIVQTTGDSETAVMSQKATTGAIEDNSFKNIVTTKNLLQFAEYTPGYRWKLENGKVIKEENDEWDCYKLTLSTGAYGLAREGNVYNIDNGLMMEEGQAVTSFEITDVGEFTIGINSWHGIVKKLFSSEYAADEVESLGEYTLGENVLTPEIDGRLDSAEDQISENAHEIAVGSIKNIVTTKNLLNYAEYKAGHRLYKATWTNPDGSVSSEIQEQEHADYSYYKIKLPAGTYGFTRTAASITNLTTQTMIASANTDEPFTLDAESEIAINSWRGYVVKLFSTKYTADKVEALGEYTLGENVWTPEIDKKISENTAEIARVEQETANAIKATKKGYPLKIDDASPITHKLNIKVSSKNLLPYPYADTTKTTNGITFTDNGDGSVSIKGTATAPAFFNLSKTLNFSGEYAFSERVKYNPENNITSIGVSAGTTIDTTLYPQVEKGTVATEYTPYVDLSINPKIRISNKNIIPYPYAQTTRTVNGITFTDNGDGSIGIKGTATDSAYFTLVWGGVLCLNRRVPIEGFAATPHLMQDVNTRNLSIGIVKGTTIDETLYPQIEIGSNSTEYVLGVGTDYTVNADGTVDGALSVTPDMSIVPQNNGLIVEVEYNLDTNALEERVSDLEDRTAIVEGNINFDCTKYGLPVLKFKGDITEMTKDTAVTLAYEYGERSGTCTLKWQGTSSLAYPKKNYTVKFDNAFEAADGWGEEKKYCLKANYIDFSHARNLIGAKLWGAIVESRDGVENYPKLLATPNGGAVDGFPICVVINGEYVGLYTFNIPKDGWMFSMGDGANEGIVCAEQPENRKDPNYTGDDPYGLREVCSFYDANVLLGVDYDVEYAPNENNVEWMQTSLRTLIQTCIDADGTNLAALEAVLDVNSAIDYYIFSLLTYNYDGITKNHLLATYDGTKWMFGAYDMDCLWGLHWRGNHFRENGIISKTQHKAFEVVANYYKDALKARYKTLRSGTLSEENFATVLTDFIGSIPKALLDEEVKIWPGLGLTSANNQSQMLEWYRRQVIKADAYINSL